MQERHASLPLLIALPAPLSTSDDARLVSAFSFVLASSLAEASDLLSEV
jgi:hypothetical protein